MSDQKYRADIAEPQSDGATLWFASWMGGPTLAKIQSCRIESLAGDMRRAVYITGEPDSVFSIPATCRIAQCRIKGYVTTTSDDSGNLVFRHQLSQD